jgi:hypothetical protein
VRFDINLFCFFPFYPGIIVLIPTGGSNDRQAQPSFFKINSVQPSSSVPSLASPVTIGTTDVGSQFKQTANAPAFGGGSSNPTLACPSGSVGTIISTVSGGYVAHCFWFYANTLH